MKNNKRTSHFFADNVQVKAIFASLVLLGAGLAGCEDDAIGNKLCGDTECTASQTCVDNTQCVETALICGENICKEGEVCKEGVCEAKPVADPCENVDCNEDEICKEGVCEPKPVADPCENVSCNEDEVCKAGVCEPKPVTDPCEGIVCLEDQSCKAGFCYDNACILEDGELKKCDEGKVCSKGECVDDGCADVSCLETETCVRGICEETACIGIICNDGEACKGGNCVDIECLTVECTGEDICQKGECIPAACKDVVCTQDKVCQADGTCAYDSDPALSVKVLGDPKTSEDGTSVAIEIVLNHQPAADVKLLCESTNDKEGVVECDVTFTADNWNIPQQIKITGVKDSAMDGDQEYSVNLSTQSEDEAFQGLSADVTLTNIDTTSNGVAFELPESLITSEAQDSESVVISVTLTSAPAADVTFTVTSDNPEEGVADLESMTFTPDNWNQPQVLTITGIDDNSSDGSQEYHITFGNTVSEDPNWNDLAIDPITLTNQDDDSAGVTIPSGRVRVNELNLTGEKAIVLNTKPTADVVLTFVSSDDTEFAAEPATITFTPENWNVPQVLTISGVPDNVVDKDKEGTINVTVASDDVNYADLTVAPIYVTNQNSDTATLLIMAMGNDFVTEAGSTADYNITLSSKPSSDVTIKAIITDLTELSFVGESVFVFTPENWNVPQTMTLKGVDDFEVDGNINTRINFNAENTTDPEFKKLSTFISFVTVDDDVASIVVNGESATLLENLADSKTFTVQLSSKPTTTTTIKLDGYDSTEATFYPTVLTFSTSNWNKPQTVTVTSKDDNEPDGPQSTSATLTVTAGDAKYKGLTAKSPTYTILDNESVAVTASPTTMTVRPGTTATFNVSLSSQPTADVKITMTPSNTSNGITLTPSTLTFTNGNWSSKSVTVTSNGTYNSAVSTESIKFTVTSTGIYNGSSVSNSTVKVYAMTSNVIEPAANFTQTNNVYNNCQSNVTTVTLYPGNYKLQVWGASGGDEVSRVQTSGSHCGLGGYSEGILKLTKTTTAYITLGATGLGAITYNTPAGGGCNGGGNGNKHSNGATSFGGGGATDIRLVGNTLHHRVIVAGGGGGADNGGGTLYGSDDGSGGVGGGTEGGNGFLNGSETSVLAGGTQTTGNAFGLGFSNQQAYDLGGGGGGWYGGKGTTSQSNYGAGGGSGYVHTSTSIKPAGWQLTSDHYLTEAKTVKTENRSTTRTTSFPAVNGGNEMGHAGHGAARITLVE